MEWSYKESNHYPGLQCLRSHTCTFQSDIQLHRATEVFEKVYKIKYSNE